MRITTKGFTLIEVMITMLIMATLTILISQSIRTAVKNKRNLEANIRAETMLYDTLRVLKLDIERAFNYTDYFFEIENLAIQQIEKEKKKNQGQAQVQRQRPQKLTHFLGEKDSLHFTTLNHFRTKYNAQESDQMEVGYFVEGCNRMDGKGSTKCLWRRTSPQIDDNVEEGGSKIVIAEDVQTFELSYRSNREEDEWVDQWRSDNKGRPDHRNKFPHFVRIEIEIENKDSKKVKPAKQNIVTRVQFPNNDTIITPERARQQQNQPQGAFQ